MRSTLRSPPPRSAGAFRKPPSPVTSDSFVRSEPKFNCRIHDENDPDDNAGRLYLQSFSKSTTPAKPKRAGYMRLSTQSTILRRSSLRSQCLSFGFICFLIEVQKSHAIRLIPHERNESSCRLCLCTPAIAAAALGEVILRVIMICPAFLSSRAECALGSSVRKLGLLRKRAGFLQPGSAR